MSAGTRRGPASKYAADVRNEIDDLYVRLDDLEDEIYAASENDRALMEDLEGQQEEIREAIEDLRGWL